MLSFAFHPLRLFPSHKVRNFYATSAMFVLSKVPIISGYEAHCFTLLFKYVGNHMVKSGINTSIGDEEKKKT
jgi:hypothetical protein